MKNLKESTTTDRMFNIIMEAITKENAIIKLEELVGEIKDNKASDVVARLERILGLLKNKE